MLLLWNFYIIRSRLVVSCYCLLLQLSSTIGTRKVTWRGEGVLVLLIAVRHQRSSNLLFFCGYSVSLINLIHYWTVLITSTVPFWKSKKSMCSAPSVCLSVLELNIPKRSLFRGAEIHPWQWLNKPHHLSNDEKSALHYYAFFTSSYCAAHNKPKTGRWAIEKFWHYRSLFCKPTPTLNHLKHLVKIPQIA